MRMRIEPSPDSLKAGGIRAQGKAMLAIVAAAILITSFVPLAVFVSEGDIRAVDLTSDPAELTGAPWYLGALSSLNLLVWAAGAAVYLLAGAALRQRSRKLAAAMSLLGAVTLVFALDDLFLLHEIFIPWVFGISQVATFAVYGVALMLLLLRFGRVLMGQPEASLLVLALLALGGSLALDVLGWDLTARRVVEEGLKLLGALAWMMFPSRIMVRSFVALSPDPQLVEADASHPRRL